ncbi:MAG: SPOR domain-containing protein [Alphaproteobacteria bacterium]|nr:SPOR domain-containing protein [Alphaproteobacteria bacterium]
MTVRNGGRQIGRSGPRIGLPVDANARGRVSPVTRHAGLRPATAAPNSETDHPQAWTIDPANGPERLRPDASPWRKPTHERLSISKLFEHMDPQPRSYRTDAYEDAEKITHTAPSGLTLSSGSLSALVAGGIATLFVIFVAGFLSAVLIFGEPNAGGELAILPSPTVVQAGNQSASQADVATPMPVQPSAQERAPIPEQPSGASEGLVTSATASRDMPLPSAPEVTAAETARDSAMQPPKPIITPPPETATPSASAVGTMATIATDTIIYPGAKPVPPVRTDMAAVDPGVIGGPGGNYSLQFGAFRDKANAAALVRELNGTARAGIVAEEGATGAPLFYVRAGAFQTRAEALEAVKALRGSAGIVTFVHANRGTG